jgi:hypothetical protein
LIVIGSAQLRGAQIDRAQSFKLWMGIWCLITEVKPTPTNAQWKMEGMWTWNNFSLYSYPIVITYIISNNHSRGCTYLVATKCLTYLPTSIVNTYIPHLFTLLSTHQMPYLCTYLHTYPLIYPNYLDSVRWK